MYECAWMECDKICVVNDLVKWRLWDSFSHFFRSFSLVTRFLRKWWGYLYEMWGTKYRENQLVFVMVPRICGLLPNYVFSLPWAEPEWPKIFLAVLVSLCVDVSEKWKLSRAGIYLRFFIWFLWALSVKYIKMSESIAFLLTCPLLSVLCECPPLR